MQTPPDAVVTREASIDIAAPPESVYDLVSNVERHGEWSSENVGGEWLDGGSGNQGDWFEGHNKAGEREWSRPCEVARAERGADFTFVVDGVEKNCTWWSFEMQAIDGGTRLTERWWLVNKTPAVAAATEEQFAGRVEFTEGMLQQTVTAIKTIAESDASAS